MTDEQLESLIDQLDGIDGYVINEWDKIFTTQRAAYTYAYLRDALLKAAEGRA